MRFLSILSILLTALIMMACEAENQPHARHGKVHSSMQIKHLNMLTQHAISMMATAAQLKLKHDRHADALLTQSAELLRRAMSGPEMSAMHHGGGKPSAAMQYSHDLGAAAFDVLELIMDATPTQNAADTTLHHALSIAAQANGLNVLADMGMSADIDTAMQQHAIHMQSSAQQLTTSFKPATAYQQAMLKLLHLLNQADSNDMVH